MYHLRNRWFSFGVFFFLALLITGVAEGVTYPPPLKSFPYYSFTLLSNQLITGNPISVWGGRNEHSINIIVLANADINNLDIQLTRPGDATWLNYKVSQLRPVFPEGSPTNCYVDGLVPLEPDLIYQENPVHLVLDLEITKVHPVGRHKYSLVIKSGNDVIEVPLDVNVWSYTLPEDLPVKLVFGCNNNESWFQRYNVNSSDLQNVVYPAYLSTLRQYKVNGIAEFCPMDATPIARGTSIESFPNLTNMLDLIMNKYKFQSFRIPNLGGQYASTNIGTPGNLYELSAPVYYKAWQQYLAGKGWVNNGLVKVWDEPTAAEMPQVFQAYDLIKWAAPEIQTFLTTGVVDSRLNTVVDNLVMNINCYEPQKQLIAAAVSQGQETWLYANYMHRINTPLTYQRIIGWYVYKHKFSGYMAWAVNRWVDDPWTTVPSTADFFRATTLVYPHPTTGMPLPTLRLEGIRRGFEDYQLLTLLDQAVQQGKIAANDPTLLDIRQKIDALTAVLTQYASKAYWDQFEVIRKKIGTLLSSLPPDSPPAPPVSPPAPPSPPAEPVSPPATVTPVSPPVAVATAPKQVRLPKGVILDGSASYDPAGKPLTYAWRVAAAPAGSTAVPELPAAAKSRFGPDKLGTYQLELVVTNSSGLSTSASVTLKLLPPL